MTRTRLSDISVSERVRRAELHHSRGMYALAREEYASLLDGTLTFEPAAEAELTAAYATCCVVLGRNDEAEAALTRARASAELSPAQKTRLESVLGFAELSRGNYGAARSILTECVDQMRLEGERRGLPKALRWLAQTHLRTGNLEGAFEDGYCALAESRARGAEDDASHAHAVLCVAMMQRGQYDASIEHGKEALAIATRLGHQTGVIRHNLNLSVAIRLAGDLDLAATHALRALAAAEENDAEVLAINARLSAGRALREAGRLEAARELVEGALSIATRSERERDHVLVLEDLGDLDFATGQTRAALEKYRLAWRKAETIAAQGDLVAELGWRIGLAQRELGDTEGARSWIARSLEVGERAGERKEFALALRARAYCHASDGNEAEARRDLEEALRTLEELRVPYEIGRTHAAFAAVLDECGADSERGSTERLRHLGAARRCFERVGAARELAATEEAEMRQAKDRAVQRISRGTAAQSRGGRALQVDWKAPAFLKSLGECRKLGPTSLPLLLIGETGTGKTLLAEALHALGRGDEGEFFPVNCAAMPEHLQESELFGHRKGAFTGAEREHPGIFREAGRGTVFLDEIDKTTLEFQAKLLHVLDNCEVRPVGSTRRVTIDARIICATNRDLFALVGDGKFLADLHHRLLGGVVAVPPLRERFEDLPTLVEALLKDVCGLERATVPNVSPDGWEMLRRHDWPGNVRELRSLLHRAVALHRDSTWLTGEMLLGSAPMGSTLHGPRGPRPRGERPLVDRMQSAEREEILRALEKANGVRRKAAEILGISYRGLGKKMVRLGITSDSSN
ncbi:MAG: sigma 54-interacting transcriptional regulator [Gemmatimonadetes bacterium]|nr:sigma 54-interacting transcriptional regulator [Gemmatimonadota bacterium]